MSIYEHLNQEDVAYFKELYPKGTRIKCEYMDDIFSPIEAGMKGTVRLVDDAGQIHVDWDNGRKLALVPGVDSFSTVIDTQKISSELSDEGFNMTM